MGNPFLFADRFSGAVVHLTTGSLATTITTFCYNYKIGIPCCLAKSACCLAIFARLERQNARVSKLAQAFR